MVDETGPGRRLQEWNDEFDALVYRPIRRSHGRVMNTAHEPPTIYRTDLEELTCDCEHGRRGPSDGRSCKHLAKAMLAHPDFTDEPELQTHELSVIVDRAAQAARELENSRDVARTKASAEVASAVAQDDSEPSEDVDPVAMLEEKLESLGINPSDFEIWVDDEYGSIQFKQDGYLDDAEYSALMDWVTADDVPVNWDQDEERNYIKADDIVRALG